MSDSITELADIGEFGLIQRLTETNTIKNPTTIVAVGDDAAVLKPNKKQVLVSTDTLAEGIDFDLTYFPLKHLGYKTVVAGISDIAAMNAIAEQVLISISLSNKYSVEALDEFYEGVYSACKHYKVDLVGGDLSSSMSGMVINITAIGYQDAKKIVKRSKAKEHDLICVTGDLGAAYTGLLLLEREKSVFLTNPNMQPDFKGFEYPLQRQLKPEVSVRTIEKMAEMNILPTSMMDITDGLASEMLHICKQSNVGCRIVEEKLPIDEVVYNILKEKLGIVPSTAVLNGGDDYELLFTVSQNDFEKIRTIEEVSVIGYICDQSEGSGFITNDNCYFELKAQGWK